jgi:hypothetical protein
LPTAYVLVLCDYNYPDYEIMSQLSKLPCVKEVNRVDGPYDIIGVKLSDNNMDTIILSMFHNKGWAVTKK